MIEYNKEYKDRIIKTLNKNENMIQNKKNQISDLTFEIGLIEENSVQTVQNILDVNFGKDFHQIWLDFDNANHKFKKDCEDSKNWIKFLEDEYFFGKNHQYKLLNIVMFGNMESYELYYKLNDIKFIINVPIYKTANIKNYNNLYYEIMDLPNDYVQEVVFSTRFIDELKEAIDKFIEQKLLKC